MWLRKEGGRVAGLELLGRAKEAPGGVGGEEW
jgi:hypothetical protein